MTNRIVAVFLPNTCLPRNLLDFLLDFLLGNVPRPATDGFGNCATGKLAPLIAPVPADARFAPIPAPTMHQSSTPQSDVFPKTRLTLLARASASDKTVADMAINELAGIYRRPVYLAVRARGYRHEDAEDHTQAFLTAFIHAASFQCFDPEKGRLRCYLAGALSHFLNKAYRKEQRTPPQTELQEWTAIDPNSPDKEFDLLCARELLAKAVSLLKEENSLDEDAEFRFSKMKDLLPFNPERGLIKQVADALGKTEEQIRLDTFHLRKRLGALFEAQVRETVRPEEFRSELDYLIELLRTPPANHTH